MKRDMELVRKILLKIEEVYVSTAIFDLVVEDYDKETIAYHCKIMHEAGLLSDYKGHYADDGFYAFGVGSLTWEGNDFLDKIRDDSTWKKTKEIIKKNGQPLVIDMIKSVANAFIASGI